MSSCSQQDIPSFRLSTRTFTHNTIRHSFNHVMHHSLYIYVYILNLVAMSCQREEKVQLLGILMFTFFYATSGSFPTLLSIYLPLSPPALLSIYLSSRSASLSFREFRVQQCQSARSITHSSASRREHSPVVLPSFCVCVIKNN